MPPDVAAFLRTLPEFQQTPPRVLDDLAEDCEVWTFREGDLVRFPDEPPEQLWVGEGCLAAARPEEPPRYIGVREQVDVPLGFWLRGQTAGWYLKIPERQGTGEAPERIFRQSLALPAVRSAVPLLFALLFAGLGAVLSAMGTHVPLWALWLLPGAGMAVASAWAALIVHEWRRSFVALRGKRIELSRLDLGAREAVFETLPADSIREAVLVRQGFWGFFGLTTLRLETDVPGGPGASFHFSGLPAGTKLGEALAARPSPTPTRGVQQAWAAKAGRAPLLVKPARAEGDQWFRRHWWFLVGKSLPWLGWCALTAFVTAWAAGLWSEVMGIAAAGVLVSLVPLGGIVWEVWDWANDRFGVTEGQVILLKRKPLWFGEVRQEVSLEQVEQLGVRRAGLAALVLDFGTVTVRLGVAEPLEFTGVARPEAVRRAVMRRRSKLLAEREKQAAGSRFEEVADIIETWDRVRSSSSSGAKS